MAYERTLLRTGAMKWPYCNGILRRWNDKNAHTPQEIEAAERPGRRTAAGLSPQRRTPPEPGGSPRVPKNARKNAEWMRRVLEESDS